MSPDWSRILPQTEAALEHPPRDPEARWHDKTLKGFDTFVGLVELHYPEARDLEAWTYFSQLNQRDALRFAIEHFRRSDFCKGALVWQLNDCWPVQSWAVIDSEGDYKAAAFELRRLFAPALASLVLADGTARLVTVLDNATASFGGAAVLEARSLLDGHVLARETTHVELTPGERRMALELDVRSYEARETCVTATFAGTTTFRLLSEPKHARLATPRLRAVRDPRGILVRSDAPVIDLFVSEPVPSVRFLDNFVTLPAAGEVLLRTEGQPTELWARSLAGRHPIRFEH